MYATPWQCNADDACMYVPNGDTTAAIGGVCVSITDPCSGLTQSECGSKNVSMVYEGVA